jgi:hypothetical protein
VILVMGNSACATEQLFAPHQLQHHIQIMRLMHQEELQPERKAHRAKPGVNADALKIFFIQRSQAGHQLGTHGGNSHERLRRGKVRPSRPFRIIFCAIAGKLRGLHGQNMINALEKYLMVAGKVGELLVP